MSRDAFFLYNEQQSCKKYIKFYDLNFACGARSFLIIKWLLRVCTGYMLEWFGVWTSCYAVIEKGIIEEASVRPHHRQNNDLPCVRICA